MPEQCNRPTRNIHDVRDAVRIHTSQIEDACIDKDCIEDLRCYLTSESQAALDNATGARARNAELLHVYIDVEPIAYHRGHYTADLSFCYRITGEAMNGSQRPAHLEGLCVFNKRVVLCGGAACAKVFSSSQNRLRPDSLYACDTPECVVEVVDPIILAAKVMEPCRRPQPSVAPEIPNELERFFNGPLVTDNDGNRLLVTLGQFSTVRMERSAQLLIPAFDYSIPDKECTDDAGKVDEPCELFAKVDFPVEAFFPNRERGRTN